MDQKPLKPWTVVFARSDWERMNTHHFPASEGEHGSVLVCGVVETERERRLLVREVLLAIDGKDYLAGRTHHTLVADFVSEKVGYCADQKLAYLAVHNHWPDVRVEFSRTDMASHERGYPALLDITKGGPVGALVLGGKAVAGDIWTAAGRSPVEKVVVLGGRREVLFPAPPSDAGVWTAMDDRQARIFGADGQMMLSGLKVAVIGGGGGGSFLVQAHTHLGVGELVVIDDEVVERVNLRRVVGTVPSDARCDPWPGTRKVDVARRLALSVNPFLAFRPLHGNIVDEHVARMVVDADAVFLAADTMQARHVFNALCHQYMLPGFQVGAKVHAPEGRVEDAFAVSRIVGPGATCMWCSNLINRSMLQEESLSPDVRKAIRYVEDVPAPSVITMNMMSAAMAMNDFLFMFTGLCQTHDLGSRRYHFLSREPVQEALPVAACLQCAGLKGRGDRHDLPTRQRS